MVSTRREPSISAPTAPTCISRSFLRFHDANFAPRLGYARAIRGCAPISLSVPFDFYCIASAFGEDGKAGSRFLRWTWFTAQKKRTIFSHELNRWLGARHMHGWMRLISLAGLVNASREGMEGGTVRKLVEALQCEEAAVARRKQNSPGSLGAVEKRSRCCWHHHTIVIPGGG